MNRQRRIVYTSLFEPETFRTACLLRDRFRERYGLPLEVSRAEGATAGTILLGLLDDPAVVEALKQQDASARNRMLKHEGYVLSVTSGTVVIAGRDADGLFYGVQTLLQMIERRGRSLRVPCSHVVDAPAHPFRGVHLYVPPKTEVDHFKRLIEYLAACKMNTVILEVAAGIEFKRHPELNRAWERYTEFARTFPFKQGFLQAYKTLHSRGGDSNHFEQGGGTCITQDDVRSILRVARRNHIRVVPEIQSPCHAYWLCLAHPEIAEWQDAPFPDTFCPSNPKSYDLLFNAMDELIDLFEPEWVHTGNDEYYYYAICPKCKKRKGGDILADHLNKVNAFLRERGIKHMVWADKLINPDELEVKRRPEWGTGNMIKYAGGERVMDDDEGAYVMKETWQAVDKIPDDILMSDWYYSLSPDTEKYFAKHRKEIMYGNFNPFGFSQRRYRLYAPNVRGGEYSSWIENGRMSLAHSNWPWMAAVSADMFWSDVYRKTDPHKRIRVFMEFWRKHRDLLNPPLEKLPTRSPEAVRFEKLTLSGGTGAEDVPQVELARNAYPTPFKIAARPLVLEPESEGIVIPIGRLVRSIVFLHGMTIKADEIDLPPLYDYGNYHEYFLSMEVGAFKVRVDYTVRSLRQPEREGRVPLRLGMEIGSLAEPIGLNRVSRPSFCDAIAQPGGRAVYAYEWVNPNPENVVVNEIELMRGRSPLQGEMVVYAITLVI